MIFTTWKRWFRNSHRPQDRDRERRRPERKVRTCRLILEQLEDRTLPDAGLAAVLVVGRTLSSYTTAAIQNNQETITCTVYNEQANPITGVLLTDTLQPGVTFQSASQLPDQSGQKLAWSLGTIQGFERTSVTLTVNLANPVPLQLDAGAQAFATLAGAPVANAAPAAVLRAGSVDPSLLASTPDANTTDPFIQEEAARLNYDPQQIFNFLHNDVGYNSYTGSVRGARGTLWSRAGNALDVASLGVALLRASGIPALYQAGTLSQGQAQQLILSMFPASLQTVGLVPAGVQTSDPANDPTLLAETQNHYWFQFDAGSGMTNADPLLPGAQAGQAPGAPTGSPFAQVPDNLREKLEIQMNAELFSSAAAAFGLGGFSTTTVLDQTFNDVDLVGRPLTVANFVSSSSVGLIFGQTTNTYSPYIELGDEAFPDLNHDETLHGTDYQEVLTNFPFGSQILTGLFLNMTLSGPQGQPETFTKTLVDRLGIATRQGGGSVHVGINASGPAILSNLDQWTINALAGLQSPNVLAGQNAVLSQLQGQLNALQPVLSTISTSTAPTTAQSVALDAAGVLERNLAVNSNENLAIIDAGASDQALSQLETGYNVTAYYTRPRLVVGESQQTGNQLSQGLDLVNTATRDVAAPGQVASNSVFLGIARALLESRVESQVVASATGQTPTGFSEVLTVLASQGGHLVTITQNNLAQLDSLPLSATAKARITQAVNAGLIVYTPSQMVTVNGQTTVGWLETDWSTGHTFDVMENGEHQEFIEYTAILNSPLNVALATFAGTVDGFAVTQLKFIGNVLGNLNSGQNFATVIKNAKIDLVKDLIKDYASLLVGAIPIPGSVDAWIALGIEIAKIFGGFGLGKALTGKSPDALDIGKSVFELVLGRTIPGAGDVILGYEAGLVAGSALGIAFLFTNLPGDPPVFPFLSTELAFLPRPPVATTPLPVTAGLTAGSVTAALTTQLVSVTGPLNAVWSTNGSSSNFQTSTLGATNATVKDANGKTIGSGAVSVSGVSGLPTTIAGTVQFHVSGTGSLSFYGPAESTLGVSGNWDNYSATATGNLAITLTTDQLILGGQPLPVGTYTITTTAATLAGSGTTASPAFAGSATITATGGTVHLGAGTGTFTLTGQTLDPTSGVTLTGYTGSLGITAGGNSTDSVTLSGSAANALTVSAAPTVLTTDQNTPVTFQAHVNTSFADTYNLTAQAPPGWTVHIDNTGQVTATPAPGLQGGTFPIQVIAQSTTNPDLVAQTTVQVNLTATQPGLNFNVAADPTFTVPFNGAQLPTAFTASLQNLGPTADTYNLTFANVPAGFTLVNSGTSVTVPAGQTGIRGIYLQLNPGQPIPAPGTPLSFSVTATSTTNPALTQMVNVPFTMPAVDAVTLSTNPLQVIGTPGQAAVVMLTLANVGNVAETISLSATAAAGETVNGLQTVTLTPGQKTSETITLTPAANASLNSLVAATITASYGPVAAPQTTSVQVNVLVRSVQTVAISQAATTALQASNPQLANTLSELSDTIALLESTPADANLLARVQLLLGNLGTLLNADPALAPFVTQLQPIQAKAAAGDTAGMLALLPTFFNSLATTLAVEAAQQFSVSVSPSYVDMQTGQSKNFQVQLVNKGSDSVALALSTPGLPSGMTAGFSNTQVMLAAGATDTETLTLTAATLTNKVFTLDVHAAASLVQHTATAVVAVREAAADVISVTASPQQVNPGDPVTVTAEVFNTANVDRNVQAQLQILDPSGALISTLPLVPVNLVPGAGNLTVNLGQVPTTGLANGVYSLKVALLAADGSPLPGHSSQAVFGVGQTVTASVAASPSLLPPGTSTVATSYMVNNQAGNTSGTINIPFAFTIDPRSTYLHTNQDPNAQDPTLINLAVLGIQGGDTIELQATGAFNFGNGVVGTGMAGVFSSSNILLSSSLLNRVPGAIAAGTPVVTGPTLTGNEPTDVPQDFLITSSSAAPPVFSTMVQVPAQAQYLFVGALDSFFGDNSPAPSFGLVLTLVSRGSGNMGNTSPTLTVEVGYADGLRANGFFPDPWNGSPNTVFAGNNDTADAGAILIVNNSSVPITVNDVSVTLSTGAHFDLWGSNVVAANGNLILTQTSGENFDSSDFQTLGGPPAYPDGETAHAAHVDVTINGVLLPTFLDTGHILTTGGFDLAQLGNESQNWRPIGTTGISNPGGTAASIVVTDNLPASGYGVDTTTISPAAAAISPSQIVWNARVVSGANASQFQLSGTVTNMAPGEVRQVSAGSTVAVTTVTNTGQQLTNTIALPPVTVAAEHIISLTPPIQTVDRNATASYTVSLTNPLPTDVTYNLSLDGLGGFTTNLAASVPVPAGQTVTVPLQVNVPDGAIPGTQAFEVMAQTAAGAHDAVEGQLTVAAEVALPALAVHVALTPQTATAGQGTSAVYTVAVANVGDTTDTYNLAVTGLPAGINATLSPATLTVAPGESNFRDVTLTLTAAAGTAAANYPFTVMATSTTDASVTASAPGMLQVVSQGVQVSITPAAAPSGTTFQLKVTNTGTVQDTFDLTLGGPAALVASLAASKVTLLPGASTMVNITTQAVNFAVPGALPLVGTATSETNTAVRASATATLTIGTTQGLAAHAGPGVQVLPVPGTADFLLLISNTGNTEDSYTATISGTSGPVTANLIGLDGLPTQTIPIFRLPGLSTGTLLLHTDLLAVGSGTATVQIQSLNHPTMIAAATATVLTAVPVTVPVTVPTGPTRGRRLGPNTVPAGPSAEPFADPPAADPVTAGDDSASTERNAVLTVSAAQGVLSNDSSSTGESLTVTAVNGSAASVGRQLTLPSGAVLTLNASGGYTYNPNGHFASLKQNQAGTDTFTYTVRNASGSAAAQAKVTLTLIGVNDPPTLAAIPDQTVSQNRSLSLNLTAGDVDGDPLTFQATTAAANPLYDLNQQYDFRFTGNYWQNWAGQQEKWLWSARVNQWFLLLPSGALYRWNGNFAASTQAATVGPAAYALPSLLYDALPPTGQLYQLNQQYNFYFTGNYSQNWAGANEKWLRSANDPSVWYIVLPSGELYQWQGSLAGSRFLATVGTSVWNNPALLHDATPPTGASATLYNLDQQYGFVFTGDYQLNWGGHQEKWIRSTVENRWFYVLPAGALYRWQGSFAASDHVADLGADVYTNPALLHNAQPPAGTLVNLEQQYGFVFTGDYQLNWGGQQEKWLRAAQDGNRWYYLLPTGELHRWQNSFAASPVVAQVGTPVWNNPALLHDALVPDNTATLIALNQQYGFSAPGGYQENWSGTAHEKWLRSATDNNAWFFVLPNGDLYRWQDSLANSSLVAHVGTAVWNDPALLADAQQQAELPHVTLTVDTSGATPVLKIVPGSDFLGFARVTVSVSDGFTVTSQSFLLTVTG